MNRAVFERLRFAYVDGELDAQQAAEVEALLRSSPEARALVEADRYLKALLARSLASEMLPPGFAHRAFARLEWAPAAGRSWATGIIPLGVITAAAACLALWFAMPAWRQAAPPPGQAQMAGMIERLHFGCAAEGKGHHCKDLPADDLEAIRRIMSENLHMPVLAPDFADQGCVFESANYCSLPSHRGAHLIYLADGPRLPLSVMTVDALSDELPRDSKRALHGQPYYVLQGEATRVLAWDHDGVTYLLCAQLDERRLLALAEPVRLALFREIRRSPFGGTPPLRLAVAGIGWPRLARRSMIKADR